MGRQRRLPWPVPADHRAATDPCPRGARVGGPSSAARITGSGARSASPPGLSWSGRGLGSPVARGICDRWRPLPRRAPCRGLDAAGCAGAPFGGHHQPDRCRAPAAIVRPPGRLLARDIWYAAAADGRRIRHCDRHHSPPGERGPLCRDPRPTGLLPRCPAQLGAASRQLGGEAWADRNPAQSPLAASRSPGRRPAPGRGGARRAASQ